MKVFTKVLWKMTTNEEIIAIANQIANDGKKPTVALLKQKLTSKVPLPTLIATLKTWQHEPERISVAKPEHPAETIAQEQTQAVSPAELEQALVPLKEEIARLNQTIEQLIARLE